MPDQKSNRPARYPTCPLCGAEMRARNGRMGPFFGCSHYPGCRGTRPIEDMPDADDEIESLAERERRQAEHDEEVEL